MTDQELIDARDFEKLYHRYRDWVAALAMRFTRNHDDAMDVVQETFTYLFRKLPGLKLRAQMKSFLYPAVKHTALRRRQKRLTPLNVEPPAATAPDGDIEGLLGDLPDEQREVVLMRFSDGLALQEIADALEVPLGTVKSRLHTALAALRERKKW